MEKGEKKNKIKLRPYKRDEDSRWKNNNTATIRRKKNGITRLLAVLRIIYTII